MDPMTQVAKLSTLSVALLGECHPDLQRLVRAYEKVAPRDFSVACGYRNKVDQNAAYARGDSKLQWPHSKHNQSPSLAVDLWPYPVDWTGKGRPAFEAQRAEVLALAHELGIHIRVISWDLPHFELI
jgi:peptidoglycan L-alanyl-D-glutamate endopeptidase CwlK